MSIWKVAAVQMDCRLGDPRHNLEAVLVQLREAATAGARLVVFPECILTGYSFDSKEEAWPFAQPVPGPVTDALAAVCQQLQVWTVVGLLEKTSAGALFNTCVLVGPTGFIAGYRKIHLPVLGVDRFTTPGDLPFDVQELDGVGGPLRLGMNICYDASFPESSRVLTLLGADLIVLPTNWPFKAACVAQYLVPARAVENHVYYAGVNRIGEEQGVQFIGRSLIVGPDGDSLASASEGPQVLFADIDPQLARSKRLVHIPGKYEIDRVGHRRPEMYHPLVGLEDQSWAQDSAGEQPYRSNRPFTQFTTS